MIFIGKLKGDDKEIEFSFSDIVYADGGFFVVTNEEGIDVHIVESTVRALEVERLRAKLAAAKPLIDAAISFKAACISGDDMAEHDCSAALFDAAAKFEPAGGK